MVHIDRKPINTDLCAVATLLDLTLGAVMTLLAQRLQLAESKRIPAPMMWLDVVDDRRRHNESMVVQTHRAQRMQR